ncbi:MAG: hypothetical protein OZSIB_4353 [Candidatus Ozemobacter sibiricus]|uniref:Flagellar protein n=1 Tax=Candidatus Ozemobacter sibiricus TaxID=2268124 RepID=A0A367ZC13_9BACT|nr:MAG: hypothetical protein OZSIB_4353 [Candidatus Ozemobacter sibiricus]
MFFPPGTSTLPAFPVPDPLATTLRILTSLAFVIALVFGLSWLLQRRGPLGGQPIGRVLGILPLDGHRSVYVVDILGKVLMLGVADHGVTLLGEVTDKLVIDELRLAARQPGLPGLEKLFKFLHRGDRPPAEEAQPSPMQSLAEADFSHHTRRAQEQARQMENLLLKRPPPPGDR